MWDKLPPECLMLIMDYYMKAERDIIYEWDTVEPLTWSEWLSLDIRQSSDDFENTEEWIIYKINKLMEEEIIRLCKGIRSSTSLKWPEYVINCARNSYLKRLGKRYIEPIDWKIPLPNYKDNILYDIPTKYDWKEPKFKKYLNFISISSDTRLCCDKPDIWCTMIINDFRGGRAYKRPPLNPKNKYLYWAYRILKKRYLSATNYIRCAMFNYLEKIRLHNESIDILKKEIINEYYSNSLFNTEELYLYAKKRILAHSDEPLTWSEFPKLEITNNMHMVVIPPEYNHPCDISPECGFSDGG